MDSNCYLLTKHDNAVAFDASSKTRVFVKPEDSTGYIEKLFLSQDNKLRTNPGQRKTAG